MNLGFMNTRNNFLISIDSLVTRIKSLCIALIKSNSTLYFMLYFTLRNYCERVRLFLHGNMKSTESRQEKSLRGDFHKYDLLRQLLELVRYIL